jgi:hypothetical protein
MSIGWKFSRSSTDEGRSGGNPSEYTFDHDLKDFVRETLQNSNDAGQDHVGATEVTYKLREITGEELSNFLTSIQWEGEEETNSESLKEHVDSVVESNADATLKHVSEEIEENHRLLVVTVEDRNTHGLYGPEGGDGPFSALVLDELITQKEGGSGAGGSYGLGKAVLWSWSGLKTVLFTSIPEQTDGHEPPRFIARTQLPAHEADSETYRYEGQGLFGTLDESNSATAVATDDEDVVYKWGDEAGRPYSVWGDEATSLAEELGVVRADERPGTSVSVLGFCEPGGKTQPSPEDIATDIAEEASKWFWPAMLEGGLEVTIDTGDDEIEVEPDTCDAVKPFIQCVQKRNSTRDILDQPGDVGVESPTFEIEDKEESALEDGESPETESGPINVYARLADPDNSGSLSNKVALIRGAGMVVKYYNRNRIVYGGRAFHGVVLAGKARPWTDNEPTGADEDIDDYLKTAEPPKHDDWEYTKKLKSTYGTESRSTIQGLQRNIITDAIKDLVRQTREEGRLIAGRLANRLNVPDGRGEGQDGSGGDGGGGSQVLDGTSEISFDSSRDRWSFSGFARITVDDFEAWEAEITLQQLDEEGNVVGTVPINQFDSSTDGVFVDDSGESVLVRGTANVDTCKFEGGSINDPPRGETQVNIKGNVFVGRLEA